MKCTITREPNIRHLVDLGILHTYCTEEGWSRTRFSVVKSFDDGSLWIICLPVWSTMEDLPIRTGTGVIVLEPKARSSPLDGFHERISCARLKTGIEDIQEPDLRFHGEKEGWKIHRADDANSEQVFEFEHMHSGGFILGFTEFKQ